MAFHAPGIKGECVGEGDGLTGAVQLCAIPDSQVCRQSLARKWRDKADYRMRDVPVEEPLILVARKWGVVSSGEAHLNYPPTYIKKNKEGTGAHG